MNPLTPINSEPQSAEPAELPEPLDPQALKTAFDEITRRNLVIITFFLSFLYLIFTVSHWLLLPQNIRLPLTAAAGLTVPCMLGIRWWLQSATFPQKFANAISLLVAGLILFNSLLHLYLTDDAYQTTNLMLLLCAAGFTTLSAKWLAICLVSTFIGWGWIVSRSQTGEWLHFGVALGVAALIAIIVHLNRIRIFTRLELLHLSEKQRLSQLQQSLLLHELARQEAIASRQALEKSIQSARTAEERFHSFTRLEGIAIHDDGEMLDANSTLAEMFGYEPLEILRLNVTDLFTPTTATAFRNHPQAEKGWSFQGIGRKKNGQTFPIELFSRPTKYRGIQASVLSVRDVTMQQKATRALHDSEKRYRHLFDCSPLPTWVFDLETLQFLAVNEAAVRNYGYSHEEFRQMRATDIRPLEEVRRFSEVVRLYAEGPKDSGVWKHRRKDGSIIDVTITSHELVFNDRPARLVIATDITSRLRAENSLRQYADRLKILRQMDQAILAAQSPQEIASAVLPSLQQLVPCERASVTSVNIRQMNVEIQAMISSVPTSLNPGLQLLLLPETLRLLEAGEVSYIRDTTDTKDQSLQVQLLNEEGHRSFLSVPILFQDRLLASINLSSVRPSAFTSAHIEIVRDVADTLALAIQSAQLYEAERKARDAAEKADRLKDEFLATVSHELRTPLNAIIGWNHLLRHGKPGFDLLERAHATIERNAKAQAHLINDLLDVSRITSGKLRLNVRLLEMKPMIEAVIESLRPAATARSIRVQTAFHPEPAVISGDSDRLQQVFWNLLSNSIKFTPEGGLVTIRLEKDDSQLRVAVTDTGKGIPAEFLPHVFDRFRQADSSSTRAYGGLGLGLAIVRHLTELHGGTVRAESPGENLGATFTISLPLAELHVSERGLRIESAIKISEPVGTTVRTLSGIRLLIVEDEADTREMLATLLNNLGAETRSADNAQRALEIIRNWQPDALVSDIGLPGLDGYWLIDELRQMEKQTGNHLPAIALTAYARKEDHHRALRHGYQMHLPKPFEPEALAEAIVRLLGRSRKTTPSAHSETARLSE
jgi:PAS domain S-box-containing protein